MPYKAKVLCKQPGCPNAVEVGKRYCSEHSKGRVAETRNSSGMYGSRGERLRKIFLKQNPFCVRCAKEGRTTLATVVDHIKPHRGNTKLFGDKSNGQSLCKSCHDKKTRNEDSKIEYSYF